jgi:hypothetical protein
VLLVEGMQGIAMPSRSNDHIGVTAMKFLVIKFDGIAWHWTPIHYNQRIAEEYYMD